MRGLSPGTIYSTCDTQGLRWVRWLWQRRSSDYGLERHTAQAIDTSTLDQAK